MSQPSTRTIAAVAIAASMPMAPALAQYAILFDIGDDTLLSG